MLSIMVFLKFLAGTFSIGERIVRFLILPSFQEQRVKLTQEEEKSLRLDCDWESALLRVKEEVTAIRIQRTKKIEKGGITPKKERL